MLGKFLPNSSKRESKVQEKKLKDINYFLNLTYLIIWPKSINSSYWIIFVQKKSFPPDPFLP
ncbi:hypothetical protein D1BOALGB6SA_8239 [Olavius sp. associated proteobacterium Delta 1]|nr:hypothetical protein D1BOALGB6SA_8239 [Olavius sp. associated proteobacterium Delta 1]